MSLSYPITHNGTIFQFSPLTIQQEEEYQDWCRTTVLSEAQEVSASWQPSRFASYMAEITLRATPTACSLQGQIGLERVDSLEGLTAILQMASRANHQPSGIPEDVIKTIIRAEPDLAKLAALHCIPISAEARSAAKAMLEKKVGGLTAGHSSPPTKSAATSEANPGVSPPT